MGWVTKSQLVSDLSRLGVTKGEIIMVHSAMRSVGNIVGGPDVLIAALLDVLGSDGTIMIYTDWEHGHYHEREDRNDKPSEGLLDELPPFDPASSRARRAWGVLPEFLRTWPGAVRSGNPGASVCAVGGKAEYVCADHPMQYGYGPGSPLAKLVEGGGKVLLAGSPIDRVTLLHYSEHVAKVSRKKKIIRFKEPILIDGCRQWVEMEEFYTDGPAIEGAQEGFFGEIMRSFLDSGCGMAGQIGRADSYLFDADVLHNFAVKWMEAKFGAQSA